MVPPVAPGLLTEPRRETPASVYPTSRPVILVHWRRSVSSRSRLQSEDCLSQPPSLRSLRPAVVTSVRCPG